MICDTYGKVDPGLLLAKPMTGGNSMDTASHSTCHGSTVQLIGQEILQWTAEQRQEPGIDLDPTG